MTTQECIERLTQIQKAMEDIPGSMIVQSFVDPEDIEALEYARNGMMTLEVVECRLKQYEACGYSPEELKKAINQEDDLK